MSTAPSSKIGFWGKFKKALVEAGVITEKVAVPVATAVITEEVEKKK